MAKVPKHKRIKRPTVVVNRARCIRSTKPKSYSPLYQKLKVNNHSLAIALSAEKQESQILFTKNLQLMAEVQDLTHACNTRDLVITNVLKNAKDLMQMIVTMSGYLTNTISSCQEFVSNSVNFHRSSTSSVGKRESTRRLSTKSPARGVVKPMVSGHTITKPTINLSRVNMQRLQDINLSIIEEGPVSPERNLDRSVQENMRSRTLPERISLRNDDDEEHIIVNRTSRFSGGRSSSGRYSKRNSGRLSGRLSKRSSDLTELIKSPRVTLQDVSRYLANNQSVNIRALNENSSASLNTSMETTIEDTQPSSPENQSNATVIPETQESCETSESDEESNNTVRTKKSASTTNTRSSKRSSTNSKSRSLTSFMESDLIDPMEGPSWLCDSSVNSSEEQTALNNGAIDSNSDENDESINHQQSSSASLFNGERRRNSQYFKVPELPKSYNTVSRLNLEDDYGSPASTSVPSRNGLDIANSFSEQEDEEDRRIKIHITQRRGVSSRAASGYDGSVNANGVSNAEDVDDFDDDDETMVMNIQRQLNRQQQTRQNEQTERLQFDVNELLQLTPLKPLLHLNARNHIGPVQVDNETEITATVQLTQSFPKPESSDTISRMSTIKLQQNGQPNLPSHMTIRSQEPNNNGQERRQSELTTIQLESSRINLPRLTEILSTTHADNHQTQMVLSPEIGKQAEVQKRKRIVKQVEVTNSGSEDNDEETPVKRKKKSNQRKKKTKDKDPSAAKVVLQKLNETTRSLNQSENTKSERKNSNESISSVRSSGLTRDPSSDSESSVTSVNSKPISTRPRRQKAPTNLQEPSLSKKLRR